MDTLSWIEQLLQNPSLIDDYKSYLRGLLEAEREKQDNSDEFSILMRHRGAIGLIKEQLIFVENLEGERERRKNATKNPRKP